jgi:hypothetical protein
MTRRILLVTLCLLLSARGHAEMPYPPNPQPCTDGNTDPPCIDAADFARYLFLPTTTPPTLPNDFGNDNWKLTSDQTGDPAIDANPQELFGVKGASVDLAWQVTTGRPDVLIAVLDSGIRWADAQPDIINKYYLNRAELPEPEGTSNTRDAYDRNRDGIFTMKDYLADGEHTQDSRVTDANGNQVIDPEDLIFLFSDGVDDDDNGYVDDISGWDFFEDDNDALDEVRYGHGTGESHDSAAEANNGGGDPGTCPNCLLLEVRVGDSFVTDVNMFAQGVVFAVDSGALVVQEALGTLNQSRFGQEAIDYAYANGAVVIASAADESSNHHNYPANYDHTVQVNSVRRYTEIGPLRQTPASHLYLNGCTNFGGHIALAVPSESCSSEATGRSAGVAGLVISAAWNAIDQGTIAAYPRDDGSAAPFPLSAEEIKQILTLTTDDINFDARTDVTPPLAASYTTTIPVPGVRGMERFHSIAGFDQYFGYGRLNANQAVRRVAAGNIPPEASISAPAWFATIDPNATDALAITGRVAANRADTYSYVVDVAPGVQPAEADFTVAFESELSGAAFTGTLATLDIGALRARMPNGVAGPAVDANGLPDPDRFTFTVRVRVIDDRGNIGEDRRTLALHHDADLLAAFPLQLGSDGVSSPITADLNGDGVEEIIVGSANGAVHAFRADGTELPGWPVLTNVLELHLEAAGYVALGYGEGRTRRPPSAAILGAVAVGDLDRDGTLEVVATDIAGYAYVWNRDGSRRAGFPVSTLAQYSNTHRSERDLGTADGRVPDRTNRHDGNNRVGRALASGPVLANLDGSADGSLEIIAGAFDRHLYAWHHTGVPVVGWPVLLKDPAKVASVNPDTNEITLVQNSGADIGTKIIVPPSVGDLDGDGAVEVVAVVNEEYVEPPNAKFTDSNILIYTAAGVLEMGNTRVYAVHHDGVAHGNSGLERGWNPNAFMTGWPVRTALLTTGLLPVVGTGSNGPPALADVDDDGQLEVGTFSAIGPAYVFRANGAPFLGTHDTGEAITFATDTLGANSNSTDKPTFSALGAPVLAEFSGVEKQFQLLAPGAGLGKFLDNQLAARQFPADNHMLAWDVTTASRQPANGAMRDAFPHVVNDLQFFGAPAVADVDDDGLPEAIAGSGVYDIHAVDINGAEATGWPKFTNGWMIGSPAVGDIDGDGKLEVVATIREGSLFAWRTTGGECGNIPWRHWHHDEWGTGNYHTDARPPAALLPSDVTSISSTTPNRVTISLARMPGDDLYCGTNGIYDVRMSDSPIATEAEFASATAPASVTVSQSHVGEPRRGGQIEIADDAFRNGSMYVAVINRDAQGNRTELFSFGLVNGPAVPPTPTPTRTPTSTSIASVTPPATSTAPPTRGVPPPLPDDDACHIAPTSGRLGWLFLAPLALVLRRRKR